MNKRYQDPARYEPTIMEIDGPPMAFFEIPLDYWSTPNGEIEPEGHPEASRLVLRILYHNFRVHDQARARAVVDRVTERLKELGGGYIWWRKRPTTSYDAVPTVSLRLGTSPALPADWWARLKTDVENLSND